MAGKTWLEMLEMQERSIWLSVQPSQRKQRTFSPVAIYSHISKSKHTVVSRELMSYRGVKIKIMAQICVARCVRGRNKERERAVCYSYYMRDAVTRKWGSNGVWVYNPMYGLFSQQLCPGNIICFSP